MLSGILDLAGINRKIVEQKEILNNITHYEVGNECFIKNIADESFQCKRLNNSTGVKSNRVVAINGTQIIELAITPFKIGFGIVLEVHSLEGLCKIKYNRTSVGLVTLTFNSQHVVQYLVAESSKFIEILRARMQQLGLKGDVMKNSIDAKHIATATSFFEATKEIEAQFSLNPSYKLIEKIMDLLREAVEQFAEGRDDQYLDVIKHSQNFLQRADVTIILDRECQPKSESSPIIISDDDLCIPLMESIGMETDLDALEMENDQFQDSESPSFEGKHVENTLLTEIDENKASIIEKEFSALMTHNQSTKVRSPSEEDIIVEDYSSFKSDGIELELNSMLGDITEEFDSLMNSFDNSPIKSVANMENLGSEEQLDMDECDMLLRDSEDSHDMFGE